MPAISTKAARTLEVTYSDKNILIEIWSYKDDGQILYSFNIKENIPYLNRMIIAKYSLDNVLHDGTFYSLEECQKFVEDLLFECEYIGD